MTDLSHVTIPTGDVRLSPRGEVGDDAIAALGPLLEGGEQSVRRFRAIKYPR